MTAYMKKLYAIHPRWLVAARSHFNNHHWARYTSQCWSLFTARYQRRFHKRLTYVAGSEATQQGTPHYHACSPETEWPDHQEAKNWVQKTWVSIVLDGGSNATRTRFNTDVKTTGYDAAIGYCLKYLSKVPDMNHSKVEHIYRRVRRSSNWIMPTKAPLAAWLYDDEGLLTFDRYAYHRAYGRWYKAITKWGKTAPQAKHLETRHAPPWPFDTMPQFRSWIEWERRLRLRQQIGTYSQGNLDSDRTNERAEEEMIAVYYPYFRLSNEYGITGQLPLGILPEVWAERKLAQVAGSGAPLSNQQWWED